jgi:hypothetical protein
MCKKVQVNILVASVKNQETFSYQRLEAKISDTYSENTITVPHPSSTFVQN